MALSCHFRDDEEEEEEERRNGKRRSRGESCPMEVRMEIVRAYTEKGFCCRKVAKMVGCSASTVSRVIHSYRANNGKLVELKKRGGIRSTHYTLDEKYREFVRRRLYTPLAQLQREVKEKFGKSLSISALSRFRKNLYRPSAKKKQQQQQQPAPVPLNLFPSDFGHHHYLEGPFLVESVYFSDSECNAFS